MSARLTILSWRSAYWINNQVGMLGTAGMHSSRGWGCRFLTIGIPAPNGLTTLRTTRRRVAAIGSYTKTRSQLYVSTQTIAQALSTGSRGPTREAMRIFTHNRTRRSAGQGSTSRSKATWRTRTVAAPRISKTAPAAPTFTSLRYSDPAIKHHPYRVCRYLHVFRHELFPQKRRLILYLDSFHHVRSTV